MKSVLWTAVGADSGRSGYKQPHSLFHFRLCCVHCMCQSQQVLASCAQYVYTAARHRQTCRADTGITAEQVQADHTCRFPGQLPACLHPCLLAPLPVPACSSASPTLSHELPSSWQAKPGGVQRELSSVLTVCAAAASEHHTPGQQQGHGMFAAEGMSHGYSKSCMLPNPALHEPLAPSPRTWPLHRQTFVW